MAAFLQGSKYLQAVSLAGALSLAVTVAGCSTLQDIIGAEHTGYQSNGSYILSGQDRKLGCRQLRARSDGLISYMQALPARAMRESQDTPGNIAALFGRAFGGGGGGLAAVDEYDRSHAEAVALNTELAQNGCSSIDIDAHLGQANERMAAFRR